MKFMEKLLVGEKVEWKTLGEVCEFKNGFAFKSNLFSFLQNNFNISY